MLSDQEQQSKEFYNPTNAQRVAIYFGYALNNNFERALKKFYQESVIGAKITQYLSIIAARYLEGWQPPLKKTNGKSS